MAGVTVSITDNASPMLHRALLAMKDYSKPLALSGAYMFRETMRQFRSEGSRSGDTWKPLAKSTLRRRRKGSSAILQDTGRLRSSVSAKGRAGSVYNLSRTELIMGTNLEYAAIHQYGGDITRTSKPGRRSMGRKYHVNKSGQRVFNYRFLKSGSRQKSFLTAIWAGGKQYTITIPARPFLVVTDKDRQNITRIFEDYARGAFK